MDSDRIPQHIAIIMDGNGRWAKLHGKERSYGHQAGAATVHTITQAAARMGVGYLTLYTFSTENWNRPSEEVSALMKLLINSLEEELLLKNNIRFLVIGDREKLPAEVQECLHSCMENTKGNDGMCLILALSYSAHGEITGAARRLARDVQAGKLTPDQIDGDRFAQHLDTRSLPDPDLLIRTGGEKRLSNFLLWQCAYSELYFCDTYWPDFNEAALVEAIEDYQGRERRFGKTSEQVQL